MTVPSGKGEEGDRTKTKKERLDEEPRKNMGYRNQGGKKNCYPEDHKKGLDAQISWINNTSSRGELIGYEARPVLGIFSRAFKGAGRRTLPKDGLILDAER